MPRLSAEIMKSFALLENGPILLYLIISQQLMEALYGKVKDSFEGGVQWYGETVKLDLEARKLIQRTSAKPQKYRLRVS